MSAATPSPAIHIPSLSRSEQLMLAAMTIALLAIVYIVQFDQGALSRTGLFMHELMHDGRHLLGIPCH